MRYIGPSAQSTAQIEPPLAWEPPSTDFFAVGQSLLQRIQSMRDQQELLRDQWLKAGKIPPDESIRLLDGLPGSVLEETALYSEGEVAYLSQTYLIRPVTTVVRHLFPGLQFQCRIEKTHEGSRTDLAWEFLRPGASGTDPRNWVAFAILEFKNTNVIQEEQFGGRLGSFRNKKNKVASRMELQQEAMATNKETLFTGNAFWLAKQAKKYSFRSPYVAVFDWDTMALFNFARMKENHPTDPRFVELCLFSETGSQNVGGRTFRILLLGFMCTALRNTLLLQRLDPDA